MNNGDSIRQERAAIIGSLEDALNRRDAGYVAAWATLELAAQVADANAVTAQAKVIPSAYIVRELFDSLSNILANLRIDHPGIEKPVDAASGLKASYLCAAQTLEEARAARVAL